MNSIVIDQKTGRTDGNLAGRFSISAMRAAAPLFRPLGFRGYSRTCQKIADAFTPGADATVRVNDDTLFSFPLNDTYWVRLVTTSFRYEPELDRMFRRLALKDYTLIDAGANFGYWSCLASSAAYGSHRAIAVEPASTTFARLQRNVALNGNRFSATRAAISSTSGEVVHLGGTGHASMSILAAEGEAVETITLDDLITRNGVTGPLIIKLDVEGVEIPALEGAEAALASNPLLLYEDHGSDRECRVSDWLLNRGWTLYDIEQSTPHRIATLSKVKAAKSNQRRGYNFAAVCGGDWL